LSECVRISRDIKELHFINGDIAFVLQAILKRRHRLNACGLIFQFRHASFQLLALCVQITQGVALGSGSIYLNRPTGMGKPSAARGLFIAME